MNYVRIITRYRGFDVTLEDRIDPYGFCFRVGYRGNGHYFKTESEAYQYMHDRHFI